MAKQGITLDLRNFAQLDKILSESFRKRDAGKILYGAVNDGAKEVRKAIRVATPVYDGKYGKKTAGGGRKVQPKGTLRRSIKSGLRRKGYGRKSTLFAGAVFANKDFTYSNSDGWYAQIVNKQPQNKDFFGRAFNKSKQGAEKRIKLGIFKRTKQMQLKINALR